MAYLGKTLEISKARRVHRVYKASKAHKVFRVSLELKV
jgi:hypothetical protein